MFIFMLIVGGWLLAMNWLNGWGHRYWNSFGVRHKQASFNNEGCFDSETFNSKKYPATAEPLTPKNTSIAKPSTPRCSSTAGNFLYSWMVC
jgi:hypothetical protein